MVQPIIPYITCNVCFETKPIADFNRNGTGRNGKARYHPCCKPCHNAYQNARYVPKSSNNRPSDVRSTGLRRCTGCKELLSAESFAVRRSRCIPCQKLCDRTKYLSSYQPHPAPRLSEEEKQSRRREYERRYRLAHPEQSKAIWQRANQRKKEQQYGKRYYDRNRDAMLQRQRKRRRDNPERATDQYNRTRARRQGAVDVQHFQRSEIIKRDNGRCYLCGAYPTGWNLTLDHVIPLSRGGQHTPKNIRVACRGCNSHKRNKLPEELKCCKRVS